MARPTLNDNPKFRLLVRRLGLPRPHVRGYLELIWECANAVGDPRIGTPDEVEAAAEWPGDPGVLFAALRDGRWLDDDGDDRWAIHDYFDHAPDYILRRLDPRLREARKQQRRARRAQIRGAVNNLTSPEWREILDAFNGACAYCLERLDEATIDHIIPLSRGGAHSADNVVPACRRCNSRKGARSLLEFAGRCP